MRFRNNLKKAVTKAKSMPFAGLGFAVDDVKAVAHAMRPVRSQAGSELAELPAPGVVVQPSGYSLLVALGREIRGR